MYTLAFKPVQIMAHWFS